MAPKRNGLMKRSVSLTGVRHKAWVYYWNKSGPNRNGIKKRLVLLTVVLLRSSNSSENRWSGIEWFGTKTYKWSLATLFTGPFFFTLEELGRQSGRCRSPPREAVIATASLGRHLCDGNHLMWRRNKALAASHRQTTPRLAKPNHGQSVSAPRRATASQYVCRQFQTLTPRPETVVKFALK